MTSACNTRPAVFFCLMGYRGAERIAEALLTQADVDLLTLDPTTGLLNHCGIPNESLYEYNPDDTIEKANSEALRRIEAVAAALGNGALRRRYPFLEAGFLANVETTLLDSLRRDLVAEILAIDGLHNAARQRDIRLLVVSEDHSRDMRALVHYATNLGIPSLHVLHGVPVGPTVPVFPMIATHYAVFSDHLKRVVAGQGMPEAPIAVTGNPAWDRLAGPVPESATRLVYPEMGLDPARPVITYAATAGRHWCHAEYPYSSHGEDNGRAVLGAYAVLAARHPDWQFLLRPRAGEDNAAPYEAMLAELIPEIRERIRIDRLSAYHSMAISDVVLCTQSNMGIEAILLGKPVINVDIKEYGAEMHHLGLGPAFDTDDAVLHVSHKDEIAPAIERALLDADTRASLRAKRAHSVERFNHPHDGHASQRVADLIVRLMEAGRGPVPHRPAPWGEERLAKRARALELNTEGEEWFAEADYVKASACFLKAAQEDRASAVAFNNLAVTFLAMERPQEAWTYVTEALHRDPCLTAARDNLRDVAAVLAREEDADDMLALFGEDWCSESS